MFDYLIVLDFEATCDQKSERTYNQEIIEFPLVVLDVVNREIVAEKQVYVRPTINPILSGFCTELTGITQDTVDRAVSFPEALREIMNFLAAQGFVYDDQPKNFCFLTCGDWDLMTALPRQASLSSVRVHHSFKKWINIQKSYRKFYKRRAGGMANMLRDLGLELQGRHHSGIDDCQNIARIAVKMLQDGWVPTMLNVSRTGSV